jgi:hypothetical protein
MLERVPSQYELSAVARHSIQHHVFSVMRTINVIPTASTIVNSGKRFPMALVPNRKTIYSYVKMFWVTVSVLGAMKASSRHTVTEKHRVKFILLDWRQQVGTSVSQKYCMRIHMKKLWFTNSTIQIVVQDWIMWTGAFMGCMLEKYEISH